MSPDETASMLAKAAFQGDACARAALYDLLLEQGYPYAAAHVHASQGGGCVMTPLMWNVSLAEVEDMERAMATEGVSAWNRKYRVWEAERDRQIRKAE